MKLSKEQARQLSYENNKKQHKEFLKKTSEGALYSKLNAQHLKNIPDGMSKVQYVEMLKKEIEQEKNFNSSNKDASVN